MTRPQLRLIAALSLLATVMVVVSGARPSASAEAIRVAAERAIEVAAALPAGPAPAATPVAALSALAPAAPAAVAPAPAAAAPSQSGAPDDEEGDDDPGADEDGPAELEPSRIGHVFVIALTSPGYRETWGERSPATYLTETLRPQGTLLSGFAPLDRAALPNYLAAVGGQPPNPATQDECSTYAEFKAGTKADDDGVVSGRGCVYPQTVLSLADQVSAAGGQWNAYAGDQASGPETEADTCRHPFPDTSDPTAHGRLGDQYATRLNPFVYFHSLLDLGACFTQDVDLTELSKDLKSAETTPNLSFISPNLCESGTEAPCVDGRPGGLETTDAFLEEWVQKIQNSPAYIEDGLIVVAFLSSATTKGTVAPGAGPTGPSGPTGSSGPSGARGPAGAVAASVARASKGLPPTGLLLVSQYADPSATDTTRYDPYSLLRTLEDTFGLAPLAKAKDAESFAGQIAAAFG